MKKLLTIFAALLLLCAASFSQELPKREFRGAWLHIIGNSTMQKMSSEEVQQWICETFDALRDMGCNAIIFQVRPQADAFYKSDIEPWTRYLTGVQGQAPDPLWDPLEFAVDQAHQRGMELHAWLNPYRVTSTTADQLADSHIYFREAWRFLRYGNQIYFDPGIPENIDYTVRVVKDIVKRYDVDAIHFDDYFYPYPISGKEFPDARSFAKYGEDYLTRADWRRDNCTKLIKAVNQAIKAEKPWVRFGISPFGIHRNITQDPDGSATNGLSTYDALFADIPLWVREGYIDYNVPQLYWKIGHKLADYDVLIRWWNEHDTSGHLYIGQKIATFSEPDLQDPSKTQMEEKMRLVRTLPNVHGNVWWPGWDLVKDDASVGSKLMETYQKYPAIIPAYTRLDNTPPPPVKEFYVKGRALEWTPTPTNDVMQQPGFYIVYRFPKGKKHDTSTGKYIYAVTKSNRLVIPISPFKFDYVVSVCDRCWNESTPSQKINF